MRTYEVQPLDNGTCDVWVRAEPPEWDGPDSYHINLKLAGLSEATAHAAVRAAMASESVRIPDLFDQLATQFGGGER